MKTAPKILTSWTSSTDKLDNIIGVGNNIDRRQNSRCLVSKKLLLFRAEFDDGQDFVRTYWPYKRKPYGSQS